MTSLKAYLDEIGRYPLLTPDEEISLSRRIRRMSELQELERALTNDEQRAVKSGQRALDRFVKCNLRWVVTVAKRYQAMARSMDILDLIQEGNEGLIRAAVKFDPERGYKFSTYSHWWIRQAITRGVRHKDRIMRLPGNIADMAYTWNGKLHQMRTELGRTPTTAELAGAFKVTESDVRLFLERGSHPQSLSIVVGDHSKTELESLIADPAVDAEEMLEQANSLDLTQKVMIALSCLDPEERQLVERRWGLNGHKAETLGVLGQEKNVTREAIRQRIVRAQRKIGERLAQPLAASVAT
jgi:RNA polymerase sigma factor (sigma-70 family)